MNRISNLLITLLIMMFINCDFGYCQVIGGVDKWEEYLEELAEEEEEPERIEALYAELSYLVQHPMNLNAVTAEMLKRLPFLSDQQIDSMIGFRNRYGDFLTIYELKNIAPLDWSTIELLLPFVYAGETGSSQRPFTLKNALRFGSNDFIARYDRTLEQKQGYKPQPDSILDKYPNRKYLGKPFYHSIRYSYTYDDRLLAGFVAEKDAGEPFGKSSHKGYDYYSGHILVRNLGIVQSVAVGDYKASFGQGLVLSHDFMPSLSAIATQVERRNNGFRRHYSTNEVDFFRGVSSTIRLKNLAISSFYSFRKLDATLKEGQITSFKTDGLHRTVGDREKMHAAPVQTYGGNIRYTHPNWAIGITGLRYSFGDLTVDPEHKPYNLFDFRGRRNFNISADYLIKANRVKWYGETALSQSGGWANLHAMQWSPASYVTGLVVYRSYAKDYHAFYGNAFGQNSRVQNEQGLYMGVQLVPLAHWKVSGYADFFRFPWLKYGVDAPSAGMEYMGQIDYSKWNKFSAYIRYRYRNKETNRLIAGEPETEVLPYEQHRVRTQITYQPFMEWIFRTSVDGILYEEEKGKNSNGWMLAQSISWRKERMPLQADVYVAYFHTDDYSSRLISYEKNLLYIYNTPFLYDRGLRFATVFRYLMMKKLVLSAKVGWSHFFDKKTIGSGLEMIEGKNKTDLNFMLQWKF